MNDVEWVRRTILAEVEAFLERVCQEEGRPLNEEVRAKQRASLWENLGKNIFTDAGAPRRCREIRKLGEDALRSYIRAECEPTWRKQIASKRPS